MQTSSSPATNASIMNGLNNAAVNEAASTVHDVVDRAATATNAAAQKVNTAIDSAAESGRQVVAKVEKAVAPAEQWINDTSSAVLAAPKNAVADARQYIVSHPWQSLAVALLAGAFLGRRSR